MNDPLKKYLGLFDCMDLTKINRFVVIHGESTYNKTPYKVFFDEDLRGHLFNRAGMIELIKRLGAVKRA